MNPELIKQAYAYGAAMALQELGFSAQQAQAGGVKLASEKMAEGGEPSPDVPWNVAWTPQGAYEKAPEELKDRAFRQSAVNQGKSSLKGLLMGAGGGAGVGAGLGALLAGAGHRGVGAGMGAGIGGLLGMDAGSIGGAIHGSRSGYRDTLAGKEKNDNVWW